MGVFLWSWCSITIASNAELCVSSPSARLHSGTCPSSGVRGLPRKHLHSCPHPLIEVVLGGFTITKCFRRVPVNKCRKNDGRENPHFTILVINKWFRQESQGMIKSASERLLRNRTFSKGCPLDYLITKEKGTFRMENTPYSGVIKFKQSNITKSGTNGCHVPTDLIAMPVIR